MQSCSPLPPNFKPANFSIIKFPIGQFMCKFVNKTCQSCQALDAQFTKHLFKFVLRKSTFQTEHKLKNINITRSLGPLRGPTSSWRPFGPALGPSGLLDFILHALRALRPCDPRPYPSQANTITRANTTTQRVLHGLTP